MLFKGNNTWFLIQKNAYWKAQFRKLRIGLNIIDLIFVFISAIIVGGGNIYYYFLDVLKIVFIHTSFMSLVYFLVGNQEDIENWDQYSHRRKKFREKLLLSLFEGVIFLLIATAMFGILHLTGFPIAREQEFLSEHVSEYVLGYKPSLIEGILIALIIGIQLISIITGIYWHYSRCMKVTGLRKEKNKLVIEWWFMFYWIFIAIWGFATVYLDQVFINLLYPEVFPNFNILEGTIFSSKPYLYLIIQLAILIVFNLFFIMDGFIANRCRKKFIDLDPLATVE